MNFANDKRWLKSCFPDPTQHLLLQVCLSPEVEARAAWEKWIRSVNLDRLDPASSRLLPLLAQRVTALRIQHRELPRLAGVLRHAWANNLTLRRQVERLLNEFSTEGVDHLLLKGFPLAFDIYPNPGARAMDDVDVLIPVERAWEMLARLQRNGWTPLQKVPVRRSSRPAEEALCFQHGVAFRSPDGGLHIDLHWYALEECSYPGADTGFWSRKRRIRGVENAWQLSPADQLLHICVHGLRLNPISSIRWIPDALLILRRHAADIDWDVLFAETGQRRLFATMQHALNYLAEFAPELVPTKVLQRFGNQHVTLLEWAAHRGNVGTSMLTQFAATWQRYRRMTPQRNAWTRPFGFSRFLQLAWGTDHVGAVAIHIFRRAAQRATRHLQRYRKQ